MGAFAICFSYVTNANIAMGLDVLRRLGMDGTFIFSVLQCIPSLSAYFMSIEMILPCIFCDDLGSSTAVGTRTCRHCQNSVRKNEKGVGVITIEALLKREDW